MAKDHKMQVRLMVLWLVEDLLKLINNRIITNHLVKEQQVLVQAQELIKTKTMQ